MDQPFTYRHEREYTIQKSRMQRITSANRRALTAIYALGHHQADIAVNSLFVSVELCLLKVTSAKVDRYRLSGFSPLRWQANRNQRLRWVISARGISK